jgi:ankyrin repeat protein/GTPase SAR1 family protein/Ran GTPase-activating protein (RanGAP) involved in mRNA processing and transport
MKPQVVDLSNEPFKIETLAGLLEQHESKKIVLNLSSAEIRWGDCAKIVAVLDAHPTCVVVSFDISSNPLGAEGATALCNSKTLFRELLHLQMTHCLMDSDGAAAIGSVLRESKLISLDLSGNIIGPYGAGALSYRGLVGNVSLQKLILDDCRILDEGMERIALGISMQPSMLELSFAKNDIGGVGATGLCAALCGETVLINKLNIGKNVVQKDGAQPLATLLAENKSLTYLDISDNGLGGSKLDAVLILSTGYDGVVSLADTIKANKTLLHLNIAGNRIGKVGLRAFSEAIGGNKCLCRVLFDDQDHIELVESGIKHSHSITDVGCEMVGGIASAIARNIKDRDAFFAGLGTGLSVAKIKNIVEKGVDIFCEDPIKLLRKASPDAITYMLTVQHIRTFLFSNVKLLDDLNLLAPGQLKILAKHKGPMTCLLYAARSGRAAAVNVMLVNGADVNHVDGMTRAPLHLAIEHGHKDVVEMLLKAGANPKLHLFGLPTLFLAIKNGHVELVEMWLKKFPECKDDKSPAPKARRALHVACKSGRARVVQLLLELGFDHSVMSGDGRTPLHLAATPEICKMLLDAGASVKAVSTEGKDALYYALFPEIKSDKPNLDVVTFLLENHADKKAAFEEVYSLDVTFCYRDNLPVWIGQLPNLTELRCKEGNSLRSVPTNTVEGGDPKILDYLRDIACGAKDTWLGFKIMVLGKEGVGKTHISHLARGSVYPRNASTDGIEIHFFPLGNEAKVPVTWFDFGGQEVFYPTHELFLTGQCVYLIVFKMSDPDYEKRILYWLKVVATFSNDKAKAVLIGTHRDALSNPAEQVEAINKRINELTANSTSVVEKLFISCVDDPVATSEQVSLFCIVVVSSCVSIKTKKKTRFVMLFSLLLNKQSWVAKKFLTFTR